MPTDIALPTMLSRYRLIKKLGAGGMGAVYLAEDTQLRRKVAVKVPHFTASDGPTIIERFFREARVAASIEHPHLCPVHDVGEHNGTHYLVMPFIEGHALSTLVDADRPWPPGQAVALVRKLAVALQVLHDHGIVHRDLKPANVMMRSSGEPVIMDFGLARSYAAASKQLTREGAAMGTPSYMAPEQVLGELKAIGPATDIYALGILLYELLTGTVPFEGPIQSLCMQVLAATPETLSARRPGLDASLNAICLKALAKKPEERYRSMTEFAAALAPRTKPATVAPPLPVATLALAPEPETPHLSPRNDRTEPAGTYQRRRAPWLLLIGTAVLAAAGLTVGLILANSNRDEDPRQPDGPRRVSTDTKDGSHSDGSPKDTPSTSEKREPTKIKAALIDEQGVKFAIVTVKQSVVDSRSEADETVVRVQPLFPGVPIVLMGPNRSGTTGYYGRKDIVDFMATVSPERIPWSEYTVNQKGTSGEDRPKDNSQRPAALDCTGPNGAGENTVKAAQASWAKYLNTEIETALDLGGGVKMELVLIPNGKFHRGSGDNAGDGMPSREITLSEPFYIGKCEVTVGQFKRFVVDSPGLGLQTSLEATARKATWKDPGIQQTDDHPVVWVSWHDAQAFCKWLGKKCGREVRLPSEAEWEYGCRAGATTQFHFGDEEGKLGEFAWHIGIMKPPGTRQCGTKQANHFGLHDMHGNVWEWCEDYYGPYEGLPATNPLRTASASDERHVLRGGSWSDHARNCRTSLRHAVDTTGRDNSIGFRVVCVPPRTP